MKRVIVGRAMVGLLGLGLVLGPTLPARSGPGMDDERMAQMMKMMGDMQEQMKGMHCAEGKPAQPPVPHK